MNLELFRKIGLTEGETKTYLSLLKLGETTVGPIGRESSVSKSKLYDILHKLIEKGLVGHIVKNGVQHYAANDPKMILEYLDRKSQELNETRQATQQLLPKLIRQRTSLRQPNYAEVYEGFHGFKSIREELLYSMKKGDELLVLGAPKIANLKWEAWLLEFHKKRQELGIGMRILFTSDCRAYGEKRKQFKKSYVRYLPKHVKSTNWIDIFNDVFLCVIIQEPQTIVIRDPSLAGSMRQYFDLLWKISND
ncbi:MAG TPA: helix-turn-helix domain-containing protein [Candidatus Nanoarchaeia archaeon]|nr:helix-turn-helix domain-containing protein [Candidatus Nanoarchaeia archaeon]